jgi:hypothetical protein
MKPLGPQPRARSDAQSDASTGALASPVRSRPSSGTRGFERVAVTRPSSIAGPLRAG